MRTLYLGGLAALLLAVFATWARGEPPPSTLERDLGIPPTAPDRSAAAQRIAALEAELVELRAELKRLLSQPGKPRGAAVTDDIPRRVPCEVRPPKAQAEQTVGDIVAEMRLEASRTGRPVEDWIESGGRSYLFVVKPEGGYRTFERPRPIVATGPPPMPVVPPARASAPVYYPPAPTYQPMPRREAAAPTFPVRSAASGWFPEDHSCPRCRHVSRPNTGNWIIRGYNSDGSHNHKCEKCGYVGRHRG